MTNMIISHNKNMGTMMNNNMDLCKYNNDKNIYSIMSNKKRHRFMVWDSIFEVELKYKPIYAIGRGTYGVVCSCTNTTTDEKVAIKKIGNVLQNTEEALKALRELRILRHARHENVIGLKDVMVPSTKVTFKDLYLVYELMDSDLHKIIQSPRPLSYDHIKYFMFQILRGLNHLHSANIIHRDLKPENVLVNSDCVLKICDFGLSTTVTAARGEPVTDNIVTMWYRAPEILLYCGNYGTPIDVWSVGCIFAELLGRKPIFPGRNSPDQFNRIINVLGTQHEPNLGFISDPNTKRFVKSMAYRPGLNLLSVYPNAEWSAIDLLEKMLVFDPYQRITALEALQHPYFRELYHPELTRPSPVPCDLDIDPEILTFRVRNMIWDEMLLYHPETERFR